MLQKLPLKSESGITGWCITPITLALGSAKPSSVTGQVQNQPGLYETVSEQKSGLISETGES